MTRRVSASWEWRLAAAIVLAVTSVWLVSLALVIVWQQLDDRVPTRAVVVLGAAQWDGKPSPVLRARVDHAIDLWRKGVAPVLVVTGGAGQGDTTTEAAVERRYAMSNGVPESAILVEPESRSTSESLRNVARMMLARDGDARSGRGNVTLVSDPFHMLRLSILARRFGLEPHVSPTRTSPISDNWLAVWRYTLQESWKVPIAFFFEFSE